MNQLPPPKSLTFEGNIAENWRRWIQWFRLYLNATGIDKKPEPVQCSTLLTAVGEEAVEVFNTVNVSSEEEDKIALLINKFEEYCTPKKNVTFEQHEQHENTRSSRRNRLICHRIMQACQKL